MMGVGVNVPKIEAIDGFAGGETTTGAGVGVAVAVRFPGCSTDIITNTRPAVSATASAAARPSPIHWARAIGRGRGSVS